MRLAEVPRKTGERMHRLSLLHRPENHVYFHLNMMVCLIQNVKSYLETSPFAQRVLIRMATMWMDTGASVTTTVLPRVGHPRYIFHNVNNIRVVFWD